MQRCEDMPVTPFRTTLLLIALTIQAAAVLSNAAPASAASCDGDARCMAREAVESPCGGADPEAGTALAALGLLSDATAAVTAAACPGSNAWGRYEAEMSRSRILGRLAVARKLSGGGVDLEPLNRAIRLAGDTHRTEQGATTSRLYDDMFADVTCDLAQDLLIVGDRNAARSLVETTPQTLPYFATLCLGRLEGVLYRVSGADEAHAILEQALRPPWLLQPRITHHTRKAALLTACSVRVTMEVILMKFCKSSTVSAWRASNPLLIWDAFACRHMPHSRDRRLQTTSGKIPGG